MSLTDISTIKSLLSRHGFHFSKSMGQNFLTASWLPERIAEECLSDSETGVLEIGPGIGCLTVRLAECAGKVVSVELDRALEPVLRETLAGYGNVEVVYGDVLKQDLRALAREKFGDMRAVACANLPYNITTPAITALVDCGCFDTITVMIQREVARRICAQAGTPDYGAFTVYANWHTEPEILFDVSPGCFMPQPKVHSSVVRLKMRKSPVADLCDEKLFFRVVRAAFGQRRKTLVNALSAGFPELNKQNLTAAVAECGFDERIRGEALDIAGFAEITSAVAEILRKN